MASHRWPLVGDSVSPTNYARGADFERRVKRRLEDDGWLVLRTAGSHSPIDLFAGKLGFEPLAIQCKSGKKKMSVKEKATLYQAAAMFRAFPVIYERGMLMTYLPYPDLELDPPIV